jgi:NADPH:quinone reductase-like Zn-dependent oxidoreductase
VKAIVIREFGGPSVMRLEEVPTPEPGPGEVLVEVHAVSVNRTLDLVVRAGKYARRVGLPHILGVDPSGVIAKVGPDVTDRKVGDRVTCMIRISEPTPTEPPKLLGVNVWGGYAQYVKVPARITRLIPDTVDFATATVVGRHAPIAFHLLRDLAKVAAGEWVLVRGAAGGLGSAGVQVATYLGAKVIGAAGADSRVEAAVGLGADAGVNYRSQDLTAEVMRITGGHGVNVVFENIGDPELFPKAFATIGRHGRLITAGGHGGGIVPLDVNRLYLNQITVMGATGETPEDMDMALRAAGEDRFKALIECVLPLSKAAEAHAIVAERTIIGKVVLDPTQ